MKTITCNQFGYTLVELVVVLGLISSLMLLGATHWGVWERRKVVEHTAQQLKQTVQFARTLAMISSQPIRLCASADQQHCGGRWQQGWLVQDATHQVLRAWLVTDPVIHITTSGSLAHKQQLDFSHGAPRIGSQGRWELYSDSQEWHLKVGLNPAGRVMLE